MPINIYRINNTINTFIYNQKETILCFFCLRAYNSAHNVLVPNTRGVDD